MKIKDFTIGASAAGVATVWAGLTSAGNASCSGACGSCGFGCVAPILVISAFVIKKTKAGGFRFLSSETADKNSMKQTENKS